MKVCAEISALNPAVTLDSLIWTGDRGWELPTDDLIEKRMCRNKRYTIEELVVLDIIAWE